MWRALVIAAPGLVQAGDGTDDRAAAAALGADVRAIVRTHAGGAEELVGRLILLAHRSVAHGLTDLVDGARRAARDEEAAREVLREPEDARRRPGIRARREATRHARGWGRVLRGLAHWLSVLRGLAHWLSDRLAHWLSDRLAHWLSDRSGLRLGHGLSDRSGLRH